MKKKLSESSDNFKYLEKLLELRTRNLHKANEELALLLELIPVIIYECNIERTGSATYIHKTVKKITGFSPEEYLGDPHFWFTRIHPDDSDGILERLKYFSENGKLTLEYRWQIADGSYKRFSDHLQQIMDKKGNPLFIRGYMLDTTKQ
jgi:PAS domain S-box-containing protein